MTSPESLQNFTADSSRLTRVLRDLRIQGDGCALLDGIGQALNLLATRGPGRRHIVLAIAERRNRSGKVKLPDLLRENQLQNTTIYWLTYSTFLAPFTNKPKSAWDRMTEEQKEDPARDPLKIQGRIKYPYPEEEEPLPLIWRPAVYINVFTELGHRSEIDAASLLSRTTGGRTFGFLKQSGLEEAIHAVADEVHRQYLISFQPNGNTPGIFHTIRAEIPDRPGLQVRTRAGYWRIQ